MRRNFLLDERGKEVKEEEISFNDLTKTQLDALKGLYIDSRLESMSDIELRKFVREVLDLQVRGTVGNEEEREVWKEIKEYFYETFEQKIKEIIKAKGSQELSSPPEEEELQRRLDVLEQRKKEESPIKEDMW